MSKSTILIPVQQARPGDILKHAGQKWLIESLVHSSEWQREDADVTVLRVMSVSPVHGRHIRSDFEYEGSEAIEVIRVLTGKPSRIPRKRARA